MRLIDADELIKRINNDDGFAKNISSDVDERLVNGFYHGYVEAEIKLMPTAFNVDKAVATDDVCEWQGVAKEFIQNPHTKRLYSNESSMKNVYCNTCGRKIKVV